MASVWLPDWPPVSPSAYDDEFNDLALDGNWTELDNDAVLTITEGDRGLTLTHAGTTLGLAGVYRDVPAGDFAIWTKLGLNMSSVWTYAGIFVSEDLDANPTTANITIMSVYYDTVGTTVLAAMSLTAYNQSSLIAWTTLSDNIIPLDIYLRIRNQSGTLYQDWSTDGIGWQQLATRSLTGTMTHIGIGIQNNSGVSESAVFPFFRCTTGTPAVTDIMYGRRIDLENPPAMGGIKPLAMHYKRMRTQ